MTKTLHYLLIAAIALISSPIAQADPPESINLRKTVIVEVEVVAKTKDAVVNISTTKIISERVSPFGQDPFFRQFDIGPMERFSANSLGSGFIVHRDGYVVTNNHVIDHARQISVDLDDGRKLPAQLISADPEADLAVLKISDKKPFPAIELGDSADLMIGEPAIAIGNPLGYSHSVSSGIISALHRDLEDDQAQEKLTNLIQTDAAINPGNSGGPLLNAYGQVVGINTAIRSDAQNIGFAIPVNHLRDLIPELMNPAQVLKLDVPLKLTEHREGTEPSTIHCQVETQEDPPRIVRSINGKHPNDIIDAYDLLLRCRAGENLTISFTGGQSETLLPKPTPLPDAIIQAKEKLGLTVEPLTSMLAEKYHLSVDDGIFIDAVARDSVAFRAAVKPGDVLTQLGNFRVNTLDDLSALLNRLPAEGRVRIGIMRQDQMGFGTLDFGDTDQAQ